MFQDRFWKEIKGTLWLAGPVVVSLLAQNSMSFIDTVMVGRLGSEPLAGMALGNTVYFFVLIICNGVITAVGPMVSQAYGAGDNFAVGRSTRQGLWLGLFLSIPAIFILYNIGPILRLLGQVETTIQIAQSYLRAVVWGFLPATWFMALRNMVEGVSKPLPVTVIAFLGVCLNVTGNYVLMYGKLGFPAFGVVGTGIATSIVYWFLVITLLFYIRSRPIFRPFELFSHLGKPDPHYFRELFRIGWPIGVMHGIETGLFMTTAILIGVMGVVPLAAHQIAMQCAVFSFMVPLGLGIATSIRVGQAVGRKDIHGLRLAGYAGILLAGAFMSMTAVLFWTVPELIISIFLDTSLPDNIPVVNLAVSLLGVAAVFQVFDGIQVSSSGALRGLKDTRIPMLIGLFSYWLTGLTSGYLFGFVFGGGAVGLWWGLVTGLVVAATLLLFRFHRKTSDLFARVSFVPEKSIRTGTE